ncbi:MerR family transcriptional regulator [Kribbella deserti]|uniref:MerR family transcriptional regulator n=1 Tax=Kribbella deserti TaxID=1926257 RepID=A0ABV6QJS1_9ACTN
MRIAELSRQSGVAVPTIKYYLREGLLPPGELSAPNQASYGERHLRRLRLIRALVELAKVPVAEVRKVLEAIDSPTMPLHDQIGVAHRAVTPRRELTATGATAGDSRERAVAEVNDLLARRGWTVHAGAPALATLVDTVAAFHSLGQDHLVAFLDSYAEAVERFTELEIEAVQSREGADQIAESVVIGTILGETLISSLRLLAQESTSAQRS